MTNTHYVDDDVGVDPVAHDVRAWPLEALATAPVGPTDLWFDGAHNPSSRQTRVKPQVRREPRAALTR